MPLSLEQYADYLDTRADLNWPGPPDVKTPKVKVHIKPLPEVRAVTWGVYGTLLRISGGELRFEHPQKFIMDIALDKTLQEFKMWGSMTRKPGQPAEYLGQLYAKSLEQQRMLPSHGESHPEIFSDKVWESIIQKLFHKEYAFDASFYGPLPDFSAKVAYFFHASLQGVACHDGAVPVMRLVKQAGLLQGLIDNGQIFTPLQLKRAVVDQDETINWSQLVDSNLCAFSFQHRSRKPSEKLFRHLLKDLQDLGIGANQVLHVGSSMELDMIPAKRLGMRTCLFAGDAESLQATKDQVRDTSGRPDLLVTELMQISEALVD